jgi:orotidine-5'-phosphate decarboxylase
MTDARDVVIWSADVDSEETLRQRLLESPELRLIKLDRLFLTSPGPSVIGSVQDAGYRVFVDAKIIEIPDKIIAIAEKHLAYRPWMLNVMAHSLSSGRLTDEDPKRIDALKRFAGACLEVGTHPCAVTLLTSKDHMTARDEFNGRSAEEQVLYYVEFLVAAGFTHVVCSAAELAAIRSESTFDGVQTIVPGIRLPGNSTHDQARTDTPASAVAAGADLLVIGRDLTHGHLGQNLQAIQRNLTEGGLTAAARSRSDRTAPHESTDDSLSTAPVSATPPRTTGTRRR